jgi:hypothetical protein
LFTAVNKFEPNRLLAYLLMFLLLADRRGGSRKAAGFVANAGGNRSRFGCTTKGRPILLRPVPRSGA